MKFLILALSINIIIFTSNIAPAQETINEAISITENNVNAIDIVKWDTEVTVSEAATIETEGDNSHGIVLHDPATRTSELEADAIDDKVIADTAVTNAEAIQTEKDAEFDTAQTAKNNADSAVATTTATQRAKVAELRTAIDDKVIADTAVVTAEGTQTTEIAELAIAQTEKDNADTAVTNAIATQTEKAGELVTAQTDRDEAETAVIDANNAVVDPDNPTVAETAAIDTAVATRTTAREEYGVAWFANRDADDAVVTAEGIQTTEIAELAIAQTEKDNADSVVVTTKATQIDKIAELETAETARGEATAAVTTAIRTQETKDAEFDTAQTAKNNADTAVTNAIATQITKDAELATAIADVLAAQNIVVSNIKLIVDNEISTTGIDSHGINNKGNGNEIIINNKIKTAGNGSFGIFSEGDNTEITNSNTGTIETNGDGGDGIVSSGDNAEIINDGIIETNNNGADGIVSTGDNSKITNSNTGSIVTKGKEADGIHSSGDNARIVNNNTIETTGENAYGIRSNGENTEIINYGDITTMDDGINVGNDREVRGDLNNVLSTNNNIVTNYGNITSIKGNGISSGITRSPNNNNGIFTNYGTLTIGTKDDRGGNGMGGVDGDNSVWINNNLINVINGFAGMGSAKGDNLKLINNGIINSNDTGMHIGVGAKNSYMENNGMIRVKGDDYGFGMWSSMINTTLDTTILNTGTIEATGYIFATGISISDRPGIVLDYNHVINSGLISVSGGNYKTLGDSSPWDDNVRVGIQIASLTGTTHTIDNYGTIDTNGYGEGIYAILTESQWDDDLDGIIDRIESGNETVNLFSSSDIKGDIDLGGGDDIMNVYAGSQTTGNINFGAGDDRMNVDDASIFNGDINTGEDNDSMIFSGKNIKINGSVDMGSGVNRFALNEDTAVEVTGTIDFGDGNDTFQLDANSTLTVDTIDSGDGNDTFNFWGGAILTADNIYTGAGDDVFTLRQSTTINADINLGDDNDTLTLFANSRIKGNIQMGPGDDELYAYDGAVVTGLIDFGEDTDGNDWDVLYLKSSGNPEYSSTLHYTNEEEVKADDGLTYLTAEHEGHFDINPEPEPKKIRSKVKSIIRIDTTEQAVKATVQNTFTSGIHSIINKRLNNVTANSSRFWTDYFNTYRQRDKEKNVFAYDQRINGGMGGFEHIFNNVRIGLMGGFSQSHIEANSSSFKTETDSYFTGLYGIHNNKHFDIQVSFIAGREGHESTRLIRDAIIGTERATADFYSNFISPSITVSRDITLTKKLILRPSAGIVYSMGWYDDYRERGTTYSNLTMDDRRLDTMNWNAGLNLRYRITKWCHLDLFGSGNGRYTDDEGIKATIGANSVMIENKADDSVYSGNMGANVNVDISKQMMANLSYEHSEVSGGETRNNFTFGINYKF
jgi:hypothetical protein